MTDLPHGTVTFLFTDIAGSTRLWLDHRAAMQAAYARHDALLRDAITAHRGVVYKVIGDALQVAFPSAPEAVAAALEAQFGLDLEPWSLPAPLRVRMVLHAGEVDPDPDGDYRSPILNRLGRLLSVAHGGQVLLSHAVRGLSHERLPEDAGLLDLGKHRLKDLLEPEHLYQLVHPGLQSDFPSLMTLDQRRHNLPLQPTPFLGREADVARVAERLRDPGVRLLTLTGPGGTGKTRLGLQAAAEMVEDFPGGVWFVPLAALTDPALAPAAIAAAVGVREEGGRAFQEALVDFLREKELLLVLDNLEQVIAAAPGVGELLAAAPGLTVLATSRAPLRLRGEREYPVPPLGLPQRKPPPTAEQISPFEAVRLFIVRAQEVRPDFAVTNESAPAVAELCHRLDGLPLAIELAAARVRLLSPQAMLARLEQRLPFLTGGARDVPARQQTLQGAISWSYDLLEPDEQQLFRRLSLFGGGFSLEAAEAVADSLTSGELPLDVLEGLEHLTQHSLVRQEEVPGGEPRFRMLETIREYGLDQLNQAGEADESLQRHAEFFLAFADNAKPHLRAADQKTWLDRLEIEHDNLRVALGWALTHDPRIALRLSGALFWFWFARGHLSEGRRWLHQAVAVGETPGVELSLLAEILHHESVLTWMQADFQPAEALVQQSLALARHTGARREEAYALLSLAHVTAVRGQSESAEAAAREALPLFTALGDTWGVAMSLNTLGLIAADIDGDIAQAEAMFTEALAQFRIAGGPAMIALVTGNLGFMAVGRGDLDRAEALFTEALAASRRVGDQRTAVLGMVSLGEVAHARGETQRALTWYRDGLIPLRHLGLKDTLVAVLVSIADLGSEARSPVRAARLLGAANAIRERLGCSEPTVATMVPDMRERATTELRQRLGEMVFTATWNAGQALSVDEAVAEALSLVDELAAGG